MTEKPEVIALTACVPVKKAPPNFLAEAFANEGSRYTQVPCPECKELMYLGRRQQLLVNEGQARLMCADCVAQFLAANDVEQVFQASLSQFIPPPNE